MKTTKKMKQFPLLFEDVFRMVNDDSVHLEGPDIRMLVDWYYQLQRYRTATGNQLRGAEVEGNKDPLIGIRGLGGMFSQIEKQIEMVIEGAIKGNALCDWPMKVRGVGPLIAASLAAYIDMNRAKSVSSIWRFAGYDPTVTWLGRVKARAVADELQDKYDSPEDAIPDAATRVGMSVETVTKFSSMYGDGKHTWNSLSRAISRKPWNGGLKTLCWKIGESFVKIHNNPRSFYGTEYTKRKERLVTANEEGLYAETAEKRLEGGKKFSALQRAALKKGRLPAGQIDLRARREVVKLFLSHWWEESYRVTFKKEPPRPWCIEHAGHVHFVSAAEVLAFEKGEINE